MDIKQSVKEGFNIGKTHAITGMIMVAGLSLLKESPSCFISAGTYCTSFTMGYALIRMSEEIIGIDEKVFLFVLSFGMTTILSPYIGKRCIKYSMSYTTSGLYALVFAYASIIDLETIKRRVNGWIQI